MQIVSPLIYCWPLIQRVKHTHSLIHQVRRNIPHYGKGTFGHVIGHTWSPSYMTRHAIIMQ